MRFTRNKVAALIAVLLVLAISFWYGGNAPGLQGLGELQESVSSPSDTLSVQEVLPLPPTQSNSQQADQQKDQKDTLVATSKADTEGKKESTPTDKPNTNQNPYQTDPVPGGKPQPVEPQSVDVSDKAYTCTLSVRCDTILNNSSFLDPQKAELIPKDGVIFPATEVTFYEGESVFNVLQREMKRAKISMEFENTPIYNSAYIEGICNLYQFDCGELSGWMYKVDEWFPNYGSSRYPLQDGDVVAWVYTCDLGADVGGQNIIQG